MTVYEDQVIKETHPNGTIGTFNRIEVRDSVIVVPIFEDGSVLMVDTYRHGVGTELLELPGGLIDEGEAAKDSATRELIEETGYSCDKIRTVNWFYTWPGMTGQSSNRADSTLFVLLATNFKAYSNRKVDELEQIKVLRLSRDDLLKELKTGGRIKSCLTVAALREAFL
jgi:ADP-ribose diphosphatase